VIQYTVDDPITDPLTCSVEVTVEFEGQKRWLFFVTPQLLASVRDFVEGTQVRLHLGEGHMVVVSELCESVIDNVLRSRYNADFRSRLTCLLCTQFAPRTGRFFQGFSASEGRDMSAY
jgi:hypothetical protein